MASAAAASAAPAPYAPPPEHHEDDVEDEYRPVKEFSVFLVDAGAAMLRPCHALLLPHQREGVSPTDTWLDVAVRVVRETLAAKIIAAPRTDESAVVFYGPRVAKGPASDDEPGVWTFNLGLEGRRNARAAALAGGGQALAALQASDAPVVGGGGNKNAGTASARATAVARHAHDSSGIDFPSADLLRALAELVGDGEEGGRGNRARERLFRGNNGNGDNGNNGGGGSIDEKAQEAKEETVGESVEALLAALRRASTLLSAATKGKRAGEYTQRIVVYSCQPLEFRSLFPANPFFSSASAFVPSSSSYSPSAKPPPFDATAATAATFAAAAAAFSQQQQQQQFFPPGVGGAPTQLQLNQLNHHHRHFLVSPETTAARLKAAALRSALRERGNALGGSCASLELVALEPFSSSSRRSAMAGGVVEAEEEDDEEERGGEGGEKQRTLGSTSSAPAPAPAATASAAADFFGDAGQQRTAWGELLLASAAAARLRAEAASARAMRAAQQVAEEELRQQRLRLQSGRGVAGAEEQSQQQLLLVAALQFKQRQEAEDADRAADFADDAALSLAVTRFSGVSRAARAKIYKRRALSTYFLLLPGGGGGGGGEGGSGGAAAPASSVACAVSLYQNLRKAWYSSAETVSSRDYEVLERESRLVPVRAAARAAVGAAAVAAAAGGGAAAVGGSSLFADGGNNVDLLVPSRAAAGGAGVGAWMLGGEKAGAAAVVREAAREAHDNEEAGFDAAAVMAERARKTVAGGVVEFSTEELAKVKCVGVPMEDEDDEENGGEAMETGQGVAAAAAASSGAAAGLVAGLDAAASRIRSRGGGSVGSEHEEEEEEGDFDDDQGPAASSPSFIEILGFVPVSQIDPRRLQRAPSFLYPNERFARGSTAVFFSLWWAMLGEGDGGGEEEEEEEEEEAHADGSDKKKKRQKKRRSTPMAALATFVRKRGRPQLVALVPHALVEDASGSGEQLEPPGLDVVYLPAADDARPVAAPNTTGSAQAAQFGRPPYLRASEGAIAAAERLVRGLCLDEVVAVAEEEEEADVVKGEGEKGGDEKEEEDEDEDEIIPFDSSEISNPALARFYSVLESLALGEPIPPVESAHDGTLPTEGTRARAAELARGLAAAVGGALDDGEGGGGAGGGGGGGGGGASARARRGAGDQEATVAEIEADALAGLNLTVDELQRALVSRGLKKSGRKEELVQRLRGALAG